MRIGLYHGYELTGSGSNEYTRYLAGALAREGHDVHVLCREPNPGMCPEGCTMHKLPTGEVHPVYLTDKQRTGNVKAFGALTDAELDQYHEENVEAVRDILARHPVDVLHCNHLVYQPVVAAELDTPFIVFPHGSSIEYVLRGDARLCERARMALRRARGVISGSREMFTRLHELFPGERWSEEIVGVGGDTSLFQPMGVDALDSIHGPYGGKSPEQSAELIVRLDAGDYAALTDYHEAYDHGQPDDDLDEKLCAVPWGGGRVLLFVGALTAGKGLHNLITALARVPDTHLVVVGSGAYREVLEGLVHSIDTGNETLFAHLRDRGFDLDRSELTGAWERVGPFSAAPLSSRVHFFGRLEHDRLRYVFPCADLAVFPSVVPEAYPLVLMEALANNVLPAVSDFSGFGDGLTTLEPLLGKSVVDRMRLPMDAAGITRKLTALLEAEPVAGLREIAVEHFDWSVVAKNMTAAYGRLLKNSSTAS